MYVVVSPTLSGRCKQCNRTINTGVGRNTYHN